MTSLDQYSQLSAYKHLLEVTQNILYSLQPDSQILLKYQSLKKAVFNKVTPTHHKTNHSKDKYINSSENENQFDNQLNRSYKKLIQKMLQTLTSFETQIQIQTTPSGDLNDTRMNQSRSEDFVSEMREVNKEIKYLIKQLKAAGISKNCITDQKTSFQYQIQTSEISSFESFCSNFMSKVQNFQLMAQVHRKMHQIIMKAAYNQKDKIQRQKILKQQIQQHERNKNRLDKQINKVIDARNFVQQHVLTQQNLNKYRIASRKLMKVLYE